MSSDGFHDAQLAHDLRQSEARLESVLGSACSAYVSIDQQGQVIDWNRQAVATFGFSREEALAKPIAELVIPPRYRAAHWRGLRKFLEAGEGPLLNRRLELTAINRAGHEFPVDVTIWPLKVEGGWTFHAFIGDATKLRKVQRQALALEKQGALGQIITLLAQETRNPLQRIQMWSEMLALELQKSPTGMRAVKEIQEAQARLERLLIDVRGYAAPLRLALRTINLAEAWREAWRQLCQVHGHLEGELREEIEDVALDCRADPQAMQQVFYHLLDNAVVRAVDVAEISIGLRAGLPAGQAGYFDCSSGQRYAIVG